MNARKLALSVFVMCLGVLSMCASAFGLKGYVPATPASFGEPCTAEPCALGQLKEPTGVAVNESVAPEPSAGDVYVADKGDNSVQVFSSSGTALSQFNGAETPAGSFSGPSAIAVDNDILSPSHGDVYVADTGHDVVDEFKEETPGVWKYAHRQLKETPAGAFLGIGGVTVDSSGNVWVLEFEAAPGEIGHVDEFSSTGAYIGGFHEEYAHAHAIAAEPNGSLVIARGESGGGKLELWTETAGVWAATEFAEVGSTAVAVDPGTENVLVDEGSDIALYDSAAKLIQTFPHEGLSESQGVATDAADHAAYVANGASHQIDAYSGPVVVPNVTVEPATELTNTSVMLNGTVGPEGEPITECEFEYGATTSYGQTAPCAQTLAEINAATEPATVTANVTGLVAAATYHFRLRAANANARKRSSDEAFTLFPTVVSQATAKVTASEASLRAEIDAHGDATSYVVEYGPTVAYGSETPQVGIGAPDEATAVFASLTGLKAATAYHYRFVATSSFGTLAGPDVTFTTAAISESAPGLPDHRAYELVAPRDTTEVFTPPLNQNDGEAEGLLGIGYEETTRAYQAAPDGNAVAFAGGAPASGSGGSGVTGSGAGNQYLARRGPNGWEATDIEPPLEELASTVFTGFSADLSSYVIETAFPLSATPSAPAACQAPGKNASYLHDDSGYHSLVTNDAASACNMVGAGVSANDEHRLLETHLPITEQAVEGELGHDDNLYDSVAGRLYQVNVLPDGTPESQPDAQFGGVRFHGEGVSEGTWENTVSGDGARVFWSALEGERPRKQPSALYARLNDTQPQSPTSDERCTSATDACTLQLDKAEAGAEGTSGAGRFWDASADGARVFFTDCHRLTAGSTADAENGCQLDETNHAELSGNDLYEYSFEKPEGERLTDLTVDGKDTDGADVQGVIGASENGHTVYFVATADLVSAPNAEGHSPVAGSPNLYAATGSVTTFIATLAAGDNSFRGITSSGAAGTADGDWNLEPGRRTAQVTPAGSAVGFMSTQRLTGYDNSGFEREGTNPSGEKINQVGDLPEVFVYQAATRHITCVSCTPSGQPPVRGSEFWEDERNANVGLSGVPTVQSRWINEADGLHLYFMTDQPLSRGDSNHRQDVYEWESDGSGECAQTPGCVAPLSSDIALAPATFLDAGADGRDVFFTQRASLVPQAADETLKLYDARVDGGFPESSEACTGTGCQGVPPAPPTFATPSSVTFNGVGNFPPSTTTKKVVKKTVKCKKGFAKNKKGKCVKAPKKKSKKAKKAGHNGRGK